MIRLIALGCFILFGVYDCIQSEKEGGSRCLKPFLMPALIIYYVTSAREVHWLLVAALAFDCGGDIFLMSRKHRMLLAGVVSFTIGHVLRMVLFYRGGLVFDDVVALTIFMMVVYAWRVMVKLHFPFPQVRSIATVYGAVIGVMSVLSCMHMRAGGSIVTWIGTLFFVYSDSLIGLEQWGQGSGHGIMETYLIGQLLIVLGALG